MLIQFLSYFNSFNYHLFILGSVKQSCGDFSYLVEDSVGDMEQIWREDIITDNDDASNILQVWNDDEFLM